MRNAFALSIFAIIALTVGLISTMRPLTGGVSSYPPSSGGISSVAIENDGSSVGSESTINFVPGTYTTVTATDAGSKINVTFDVDTAVLPVATIPLSMGACNSGPTYTGGEWSFQSGVTGSCQAAPSSISINIANLLFDAQNDETIARFMYPANATTTFTLRTKWRHSSTVVATVESTWACIADDADATAATESSATSLTFSPAFGTANDQIGGTVTFTDAALTANKMCFVTLKRTDAGGGNLFLLHAQLEF